MSGAEQYASWVLAPGNERETGRLIKLAAQRFMDDMQRTDIYFDEAEAVKMINFGERYCFQWEGDWRGKPFKFEPWQRFVFEQLYGWIRKDNGRRRYTKLYLQIAKKNGKSSMCAVLSLFHLFADERINTPKVFTAANNEDQAKICVNMAGRIVEQSDVLYEFVAEGQVKLSKYGKNITEVIHQEKDGFITAMSKEGGDKTAKTSGGKHGINASLGLIDEFGMSPDHGASGSIATSMAARLERLMAYFTTAGFNMSGPCYSELRDQGIKVLDGVQKIDNYLPVIFEMDPPVDAEGKTKDITIQYLIDHPEFWKQSNPNLSISVNPEYLHEMLQDAKSLGGTTEVEIKTLNFNMWVDSPEVFIPADVWNQNTHGLSDDSLSGQCFSGIEVGPSGEIIAVALLFPGDIIPIRMVYLIAKDSLLKNETYLKNKDSILIDEGNEVENDWAIEKISGEFQKHDLHSFCFPVTHKNNSIIQGLIKLGYVGNPISQGMNGIANATMEWEKLLRANQVEHFNDEILRWMNANCLAVKKEAGTRIEKSSKVLGIYACINAVAQWKTIEAEGTDDQIIQSW